jgi:hypothetical protein
MSTAVAINNKEYVVNENEFHILHDPTNVLTYPLLLRKNVGHYERISSLINELSLIETHTDRLINNVLFVNPTHGGFAPLQCIDYFENVYISLTNEEHCTNIMKNIKKHETQNIFINGNLNFLNQLIIFSENQDEEVIVEIELLPILIINKNNNVITKYNHSYAITNTDLCLYVPDQLYESFYKHFHYFIKPREGEGHNSLLSIDYDNMIHLCIMVKDAGEQFENMLIQNLPIIDRWTILDTGSTDNTIEIINKILVGKKKGELFQESFINFRDSRNRCLDLAGTTCKYTIMLDDTYVVNGDFRKYMNVIRDDQYADSYSLTIKSNDIEYTSNRIIKTDRCLRYIYKIHEIIQDKNNVNLLIPYSESTIIDKPSDYMTNRTTLRKEYDLQLLLEEMEEDPYNSRHLYYIAQTYNLLNKPELAYEYFLKRANHVDEGFIQERVDSLLEAGRIAEYKLKLDWSICYHLYRQSYELDKTRPDALYFMGIHYYYEKKMDI